MAKRSIFAPWRKDTTPPARTPAPTDDEADAAYLAERDRAAGERITESMDAKLHRRYVQGVAQGYEPVEWSGGFDPHSDWDTTTPKPRPIVRPLGR